MNVGFGNDNLLGFEERDAFSRGGARFFGFVDKNTERASDASGFAGENVLVKDCDLLDGHGHGSFVNDNMLVYRDCDMLDGLARISFVSQRRTL